MDENEVKMLDISKHKVRGVMFKIDSTTFPEIANTKWNVASIESKESGKKVVHSFLCTLDQYRALILPFWRLKYTRTATFEVYQSPVFRLPILCGVSEIEPAIAQGDLF